MMWTTEMESWIHYNTTEFSGDLKNEKSNENIYNSAKMVKHCTLLL